MQVFRKAQSSYGIPKNHASKDQYCCLCGARHNEENCVYRSYRAGNQKFQQFDKIRNRLNNDSFYEKAVYGGGSGGTGPIPYKSAYQSRVQADPRVTDPWRSVKETKIIGKRKAPESSSDSESSGGWKNKKRDQKSS